MGKADSYRKVRNSEVITMKLSVEHAHPFPHSKRPACIGTRFFYGYLCTVPYTSNKYLTECLSRKFHHYEEYVLGIFAKEGRENTTEQDNITDHTYLASSWHTHV